MKNIEIETKLLWGFQLCVDTYVVFMMSIKFFNKAQITNING